jgi:hypothetical protein
VVALAAHAPQTVKMALFALTRDRVDRNHDRLFVALHEVVDANQDALAGVDLLLVAIRRVGYLALREAVFDRTEHATHSVDLGEILEATVFHLIGERFDNVASTQRVDGVGRATLVGDDLLGSQRYPHRFF